MLKFGSRFTLRRFVTCMVILASDDRMSMNWEWWQEVVMVFFKVLSQRVTGCWAEKELWRTFDILTDVWPLPFSKQKY